MFHRLYQNLLEYIYICVCVCVCVCAQSFILLDVIFYWFKIFGTCRRNFRRMYSRWDSYATNCSVGKIAHTYNQAISRQMGFEFEFHRGFVLSSLWITVSIATVKTTTSINALRWKNKKQNKKKKTKTKATKIWMTELKLVKMRNQLIW